ncbi:MAG: undecaprenyl-diphosphate phosphatase [Ruminococcaceae bacterium]|nr:undecaprenyl-diphosphate phosphatase [Oscillospiraceae bacterium]
MTLFEAILFGIIQGLTEFLPVSSSGHLALFQNILGMEDPERLVAFNVLLHLGTLVAVFIMYWKDILPLIPAFFTLMGKVFKGKFKFSEYTYNERFVLLIIIATIPLLPAALLEDKISFIAGYLSVVGAILVINGGVLLYSDKLSRGNLTIGEANGKNALFIGMFQAFAALLPGLSRSGSTITGGLLSGFDRQSAVKFSFIMSLPAIAGACVLKLPKLFEETESMGQLGIYAVGAVVAAIVGLLAMKLLTYISKKSNFKGFAYYCFAAGILAIVWDTVTSISM